MPTYSILSEWKGITKQYAIKDDKALTNALMKLRWELKDDGDVEIGFKDSLIGKIDGYSIKKNSYIEYKKICWKQGLISHDDVLIDEFQDTSPIQSKLIEMIAEKETVIGVIGDACQSIYSFQVRSLAY